MAATTSTGFDVVLSDDFSGGFKAANWGTPFDGGTYWNGMFEWSKDDVAVRNGAMEVSMSRHADGSWTAGGFNSIKAGKSITYGKIEFDGKVEEAQGTMGVFLTWPQSDDNWPRNGEIDILETPGGDVMHTTHWEDVATGEHLFDSVRNASYDETQWNHYELLWLPDHMTLKVNGKVVADWTDPAAIPDVAHGIGAMGMVASDADTWMGGAPDASTPDKVTVYMDNVVMSQWDGKTVPKDDAAPKPPLPKKLSAGSGSDTLVLKVSQDAYQGDAQYTVSVDGKQIGDTFTAAAWHSAGQSDTLTIKGNWAAGAHKVEVKFLNDAWSGTPGADRNLHVDGATYNGKAVAGAAQAIMGEDYPGSFSFTEAAPVVKAGTAAADVFEATAAGGVFTGGGGADRFAFGAGDGHVTIKDFASRTDKLVFEGFDAADVATAKATQGGVSGLAVSYGDTGTVFLAGVGALAAGDMMFA